jgi:uncharacterized protein YkwD
VRILLTLALVLIMSGVVEARGRRGSSSGGSGSVSHSEPIEKYEGPVLTVEHRLLERINEIRIGSGLGALVLDPILKLRARRHCAWMANSGSMVHSNDGAENIAMGQHDTDDVVDSWMRSSGHRANILNPNWKKAGMVGYSNGNGTPFWCQQFSN